MFRTGGRKSTTCPFRPSFLRGKLPVLVNGRRDHSGRDRVLEFKIFPLETIVPVHTVGQRPPINCREPFECLWGTQSKRPVTCLYNSPPDRVNQLRRLPSKENRCTTGCHHQAWSVYAVSFELRCCVNSGEVAELQSSIIYYLFSKFIIQCLFIHLFLSYMNGFITYFFESFI